MKAILFDFNGTMIFDEEIQEESWRIYIQQKIGHCITDEEFQLYVHGRNVDFTFSHFMKQTFARDEIVEMEEGKERIYRKLCLESDKFCLVKGLERFLDELKEHHIPMTIATAAGYGNVQFFFEHLGLDRWFDIRKVAYNDGEIEGKPAPDLYLKAADMLGVDVSDCIVFEDSISGIEAARNAGAEKIIRIASMDSDVFAENSSDEVIADYTDVKFLECITGISV